MVIGALGVLLSVCMCSQWHLISHVFLVVLIVGPSFNKCHNSTLITYVSSVDFTKRLHV